MNLTQTWKSHLTWNRRGQQVATAATSEHLVAGFRVTWDSLYFPVLKFVNPKPHSGAHISSIPFPMTNPDKIPKGVYRKSFREVHFIQIYLISVRVNIN